MKKFCCMILALLLCLAACGCQTDQAQDPTMDLATPNANPPIATPTDSGDGQGDVIPTPPTDVLPDMLPPLDESEFKNLVLDKSAQLYCRIVEKVSTDVLVVEPDYDEDVQAWGKTVYIITDESEDFCVGERVIVLYKNVKQPYNKTHYVRIIAERVDAMFVCAKPIIYLYPETPTQCSVKLTLNGELTCTYPDYGKTGWNNFTAYPDSTLIFPDGKEYYALYWEGIQAGQWDFSKGFCVPGEDTAKFLEWALAEQGLTRREANEFIVYWLPLMQDNPYNVISFQTTTYTDGAVLDIQPAPDAMLRVFMAYYPTDNEVEIQPQAFEEFIREGFTVVEWGGSVVNKP